MSNEIRVFDVTFFTETTGMGPGMIYVIGNEPTVGQIYVGKLPWRALHHMDESRADHIKNNVNHDARYLPVTQEALNDLTALGYTYDEETRIASPPAQA